MLLNPETEIFYSNYEKLLTSAGICFLHNEHTSVQLKGNDFVFHGLELPVEYYHKPNSPALSLTAMEEMIGTPSQPGFHVLLAHNPKYGNTYFSWGADLILSGHYSRRSFASGSKPWSHLSSVPALSTILLWGI